MNIETMVAIMVTAMFTMFGVDAYLKADVKKACYEAAKVRLSIECDK